MDSKGNHLCKNVDRRLNVDDFVLSCPRAVVRNIVLPGYCDSEVLMPRDRPILFLRLIEENTANRTIVGLRNQLLLSFKSKVMEML